MWENVYENERRISPGIRELRIPCEPNPVSNWYSHEGQPIDTPQVYDLKLNRYQCSLHLDRAILIELSDINSDAIRFFIEMVSKETQNRLARMQPVSEGHPVIIDRVNISEQVATYQIVINIDFWAIQHADADLGRAAFERTMHECLLGMRTHSPALNNPLPHLDPSTFHREGYDLNAEENAHILLKGMLTKTEFDLYKTEGYVMVKGTYGRTYRVNKNNMIQVVKKIKGKKKTTYRLCIEPRDQGTICPTDEVIAKIKLIQSSEKELHKIAIKWNDEGFIAGEYSGCTIIESYR